MCGAPPRPIPDPGGQQNRSFRWIIISMVLYFLPPQVQQAWLLPALASRPISPHRKAGSARSGRPPPVTQNSLTVCGQTASGTALRQALGLRSTCFTVQYQSGNFSFTTRGYGHGVGLSQWGAKGHGRAGRGLYGYFSSLLPRNTAAQDGVVTENSIS